MLILSGEWGCLATLNPGKLYFLVLNIRVYYEVKISFLHRKEFDKFPDAKSGSFGN